MRARMQSVTWSAALAALITLAVSAYAGPPEVMVSSGEKSFRLSEARGKFVALQFLLKTECPYCLRHVEEISRRAPELAGVHQVFLKPDSEEEIKSWSGKLAEAGVPATIYRDPEAKLADQLKIPDGYKFHGQSVHFPATILLGPDGSEVFRYIGKDNTDRLSFDRLAAKVAELSRSMAVEQYNLSDGALALKGHDPVAYIDRGKAEAGSADLSSRYHGVVYRFADAANRQKFADNPDAYVPAYGGWCATAMAEGRKVEIDPASFKVTNGRLFLFYKGWRGNALSEWNRDETNLAARADENWRRIAPADSTGRK